LKSALAVAATRWPVTALLAGAAPAVLAKPEPFDYARLKGRARALALANAEYRPPSHALPKALSHLDYDQFQAIKYRPDRALWADRPLDFRVQFFHLGYQFKEAVQMHEVVNGQAQPIAYKPSMFDFGKSGLAAGSLPSDLGFAGLRLHFHTNWRAEVGVFLGASYFRARGGDNRQYGLSARGLALNTAIDSGEEFPRFTAFWLERPAPRSSRLTLYALLDSPSIAGAYRFDITPGATLVMEVDAALYPRKPIERLGLAPLTSMFECGENDRCAVQDWRPEIHDSDGLSVWTGSGEWIWRPLTNPSGPRVNSFLDQRPRGFGVVQRDRDFNNYQDESVYYEHRPSLWVEPRPGGDGKVWDKGAVQLVELHAKDETFDNIVAFWNPAEPAQPGQELLFSYRLHWGTQLPYAPTLAQVAATRTGRGGVVGRKREYFSWRFVVDFEGPVLDMLAQTAVVEPVITTSRGEIEIASARPRTEGQGWRVMFDLKPTDEGPEPFDLRLYLRMNDQPLSETWVYQWIPPLPVERKLD
jgi:glucans biosynthesis protein